MSSGYGSPVDSQPDLSLRMAWGCSGHHLVVHCPQHQGWGGGGHLDHQVSTLRLCQSSERVLTQCTAALAARQIMSISADRGHPCPISQHLPLCTVSTLHHSKVHIHAVLRSDGPWWQPLHFLLYCCSHWRVLSRRMSRQAVVIMTVDS
jgi:hypothetical protein